MLPHLNLYLTLGILLLETLSSGAPLKEASSFGYQSSTLSLDPDSNPHSKHVTPTKRFTKSICCTASILTKVWSRGCVAFDSLDGFDGFGGFSPSPNWP